jgi:hypothetical protein
MSTAPGGRIQTMAMAPSDGTTGNGAVLFVADEAGVLWFTKQMSPGGAWQEWIGPKFGQQPLAAQALAVAGQNNGKLMLAMLDEESNVWSLPADSAGNWGPWLGPKIGDQQFSFKAIAAGMQTGDRGIQLVAVDDMGFVWTCYQMDPGWAWSGWTDGMQTGAPAMVSGVALGGQNNGCLILFAEAEGLISYLPQTQAGGSWGSWSTTGMAAGTNLYNIVACEQGGSRGVQFWGLNTSGEIWSVFQDTAGGSWDPWQGPGWNGQPAPFVTIAATDQGNGCALFLGVDEAGLLWATWQTSPGGDWGPWTMLPAPPG